MLWKEGIAMLFFFQLRSDHSIKKKKNWGRTTYNWNAFPLSTTKKMAYSQHATQVMHVFEKDGVRNVRFKFEQKKFIKKKVWTEKDA